MIHFYTIVVEKQKIIVCFRRVSNLPLIAVLFSCLKKLDQAMCTIQKLGYSSALKVTRGWYPPNLQKKDNKKTLWPLNSYESTFLSTDWWNLHVTLTLPFNNFLKRKGELEPDYTVEFL